MNLHGRTLSLGTIGNDVETLHHNLRLLGYSIDPDEAGTRRYDISTHRAVMAFQQARHLVMTGIVDDATAAVMLRELELRAAGTSFVVQGTVRNPNGTPYTDGIVRAFDRDLRNEQPLGETTTDAQGHYEISYSRGSFKRAEKKSADLVVKVFDKRKKAIHVPTMDEILFNAPASAVVDILIKQGDTRFVSEFERIVREIKPLIEPLRIGDLKEDAEVRDITFLNRETGWRTEKLEHLVVAHRLAEVSKIVPEFFYALLREGTLLRIDISVALNVRLSINLTTEILPLFYDIVLFDPEKLEKGVAAAIRRRLVPAELAEKMKDILAALAAKRQEAEAYMATERPQKLFRLISANVAAGRHKELLKILTDNYRGDIHAMVNRLAEVMIFPNDDAADDAGVALAIGEILGFDERLVETVRSTHGVEKPEDVQKLAALNPAAWRQVLAPTGVGESASARRTEAKLVDLHASSIARRMEARYPTTAFAAQLGRDTANALPGRTAVAELLDSHPDLDLASANLGAFFRERKIDTTSAAGVEMKTSMEKVQRIFKLAPRYRTADAIMKTGVDSAGALYEMGETQFVAKMSEEKAMSKKEAKEIFKKAEDIHIASALIAADLKAMTDVGDIAALGTPMFLTKIEAVSKEFPDLKSLFQTIDLCGCEHCRSVYSPAAYMVDTLQFIRNRKVTGGPDNARTVLFTRRPDIGDMDLSCRNTNTPLPYIDVVCEVLEEAVKPDPGIPFDKAVAKGKISADLLTALTAAPKKLPFTDKALVYDADKNGNYVVRDEKVVCKIVPDGPGKWKIYRLRQTYGTAEQLAAAPEYLNDDAYVELAGAKYAFHLPFDLYHEEARGYFGQFEVRRTDLMEAMKVTAGPKDEEIAADIFGLSDTERELITVAKPADQDTYWNAAPAKDVMKVVDTFLTKSELSYAELEDLLKLRFVNPGGKMFVKHLDETCDTAQKHIQKLDEDRLDALHRFIRMWRRSGWGMATLDRAIASLGATNLDAPALARFGALVRLQEALGLEADELLTFYSAMPWEGAGSRYAQVFLNAAANGAIDEAFLPANVLANEAVEAGAPGTGKKLALYKDYLALSLGRSAAEIGMLLDRIGNVHLSFANISRVYAMSLLARTLGLGIEDFLILEKLIAVAIFNGPAETLSFVEKARRVGASGLKPLDLRFLINPTAADLNERGMRTSAIEKLIGSLRTAYKAAAGEASPFDGNVTVEENIGVLRELFSRLPDYPDRPDLNMPAATVDRFVSIVDETYAAPPPVATFVDQHLLPLFDTALIKTRITELGAAPMPKTAERLALLEAMIDAAFLYLAWKDALVAEVASTLGPTPERAEILLRGSRLKAPPAGGGKALLELLTIAKIAGPDMIDGMNFPNQFRALRLLHMTSALLGTLGLDDVDVAWMLRFNAPLGWMELDNLPYEAGIPAISFADWEKLQDAIGLFRSYPPVKNPDDPAQPFSFRMLLELVLTPGTTIAQVAALLAKLTGWDEATAKALDLHFGFSAPDITAYKSPATYLRLERGMDFLRRLRIDVPTAQQLIKPKLVSGDVTLLRQALKSRYEEGQWLGVLRTMQDTLRHRKRDALVAYLLATNPDLKGSNDLYEYFLIDVEMCACQPTSRIVQAHGTIQLFVQRCRMGLEPKAVADVKTDRNWEQWKWMRNYRVWEANRKVFLYPENWIEPELRDDKSFFFKDLENQLMQNELTDRAVEDAAIGYLEKLDEIAMLEVAAVYYQTDLFIMHVFARTKGGDPPTYYYRRFEKERYWTPWEKVDVDISGDHLVAFMRNNRLYLAWPVFTEEPNEAQEILIPDSKKGTPIPKGEKRLRVQIAISEFSGKKWLPKKVSKEGLPTSYYQVLPDRANFRFMAVDLRIVGFYITCSYVDNGTLVDGTFAGNVTVFPGMFGLAGCKGYPVMFPGIDGYNRYKFLPEFHDTAFRNHRFTELGFAGPDDLAIKSVFDSDFRQLLKKSPGTFRITYPHQMSNIDIILFLMQFLGGPPGDYIMVPLGTYMPYFFEDDNRGYAVLPGFFDKNQDRPGAINKTFSDILAFVDRWLVMAFRYLPKFVSVPGYDVNKFLDDLVKDPDFPALWSELGVYGKLNYGARFKNFYHPLVCHLRAVLYRDGIPALMQRETQLTKTGFSFAAANSYDPTPAVIGPYPEEDIDFRRDGSYSSYNWELFFHLPFTIACRLSQDQRFEEAMTWFHYIFNPIGSLSGTSPQKYWVTKPFFQTTNDDYRRQRIDTILGDIAKDPTGATIGDLKFAVEEWRSKPFSPHVIARSRTVAYQKAVLMKYIDNLIAWGDSLFRQDTMESVNQATQMYVLADKLLGPKPRIVPPAIPVPPETYNQLESKIDLFGNALLTIENLLPDLKLPLPPGVDPPPAPLTLTSLYFCIPPNDKMLEYWDRVADRLFKIRHCQNIDGVERTLALFAPPIDPGMLVRAAAAGLDIGDVLGAMSAPLPNYRFNTMAQKAGELAQQVSALGGALLQAMEKRDAEAISRLRSEQELKVLKAIRQVKERQRDEAEEQITTLNLSRAVVKERLDHFARIQKVLPKEQLHIDKLGQAQVYQESAQGIQLAASLIALIPDIDLGASGFGGTPLASFKFGGLNLAQAAKAASDVLSFLSLMSNNDATMASITGGFERRWDDWKLQERVATKEIAQIDQQIAAARIRLDIARKELDNHDLQIQNTEKSDELLRSKFTNKELYDWMVGQVSSVYFRAYQLAHDVARKAERCFRHELGLEDSGYISFGYWDSLRKGLMTAEHLLHDIKRMEVAYLDRNKREYELTKHVSLAQLDPRALVELRSTGKCTIVIPETLFDMDHPGHYMRRLKGVSLSVPCVAGPYTSVSCKLSLVNNRYRKNTANAPGAANDKQKYTEVPGNDTRFVYNVGAIQSIATSTAQNDSGMFEFNFRDERYLPFEGAGAIGTWKLEMPASFRQFDYSTITDVILQVRYTARDGGSPFKGLVEKVMREMLNELVTVGMTKGLFQAYSFRHELPNEWHKLKRDAAVTMTIGAAHLPFFVQGHKPAIQEAVWIARVKGAPGTYAMGIGGTPFTLTSDATLGGLCAGPSALLTLGTPFNLTATSINDLEDLVVLIRYTLQP